MLLPFSRIIIKTCARSFALAAMLVNHLVNNGFSRVCFPGVACSFCVFFALITYVLHKGQADFVRNSQWSDRHTGKQAGIFNTGWVNTLSQHADAFINKGSEDPGGEETTAIVHYDGNFANLLHVIKRASQGFVGGFVAYDNFYQLHLVYGREEMQADKVFWLTGGVCQLGNRNGGGV